MNPNNINNTPITYNNFDNIFSDNICVPDEQKITINFIYNTKNIEISYKPDEKIRNICEKFCYKIGKDINNIQFLYAGNIINMNKLIFESINNNDKERKIMPIMAIDMENNEKYYKNIIKANHIICPICKESALINFENFKTKIFNCKNGHTSYLLFNEFEESQKIDEAKIICNNCCTNNKANSYKNIMNICNTCKMNLCLLCAEKHDKNHNIINYEQKYYTCELHNRFFNSYCEHCKKDICVLCEPNHQQHQIISYSKILPNIPLLNKSKQLMKKLLEELDKKITEVINKMNNIKINLEIYYNLVENMINNYSEKNINFKILRNMYDIVTIEKQNIFKDINKINIDTGNFLNNITIIYEQMNNKFNVVNNNNSKNSFNNNNNYNNTIKNNSNYNNSNISNNQKQENPNYVHNSQQLFPNIYLFPLKGLKYIESTYYMNATLQCLLHVSDLIVYFIDEYPKDQITLFNINKNVPTKGNISSAFFNLVNGVNNSEYIRKSYGNSNDCNYSFPPEEFKNILINQFKKFENSEPKNLILFLLQSMHKELNFNGNKNIKLDYLPNQYNVKECFSHFTNNYNKNNKSKVCSLFFGILKNSIKCQQCNNILYTFERPELISFKMSNYHNKTFNILEGFQDISKPNILDQNFCTFCNRPIKAIKESCISVPPKNLIINIDYGKNRNYRPSRVDFDEVIDINQFVDYKEKCKYRLICICSCLSGNHYVAFCWNRKENKWYEFNDASVREIDKNSIHNGFPYLLFYEKIYE